MGLRCEYESDCVCVFDKLVDGLMDYSDFLIHRIQLNFI